MAHTDPPLPDYDELPFGTIESRVRTLDANGLRALLAYETAHADRVQVVQLVERRLEAVAGGEAEPSGGDPDAATPEADTSASHDPKASPQTQGPPINPPSHGDPSNPAQPRR